MNGYQLFPNIRKMNIKQFVKWAQNAVVTRAISFLKYSWLAVLNLVLASIARRILVFFLM